MNFFDPSMMDPSKLKPETLMKMSQLIQELPPAMLSRMQTLMHNAMAGFDVKQEMARFEADLPSGFREKMARIMYEAHGAIAVEPAEVAKPAALEIEQPASTISTPREAQLRVLAAVASGDLTPEQALEVLFPEG